MSAELASSGNDSRDTLLLYCPYDRKVTRHARRGPDNAISCVECGRRLEVTHTQRTAQIVPVRPLAGAYAGPRTARSRRGRRRRPAPPWMPFLLVGVVTAAALFALMSTFGVVGNPFAGGSEQLASQEAAPAVAAAQEEASSSAGAEQAAPVAAAPQQVKVANTGGTGVFLRRSPNMNDRLRAWKDGTALKVVGPDVSENGVNWKHVQDPAGNDGWVPAQYTAPAT